MSVSDTDSPSDIESFDDASYMFSKKTLEIPDISSASLEPLKSGSIRSEQLQATTQYLAAETNSTLPECRSIVQPVKTFYRRRRWDEAPIAAPDDALSSADPPAPVHKNLSIDLWRKICDYLYPSQMVRLSRTCKASRSAVCNLAFWRWLFLQVYPNDNTRLCFLPCLPESHSYMQYMCAISPVICEQCFKYLGKEFYDRVQMPLPVPAPVQTRCTKKITYLGEPIDTDFTTRLCLPCRKAFFLTYEEPIPEEIEFEAMTLEEAKKKYPNCRLPAKETSNMTKSDDHYCHGMFLEIVRKRQGGDVGVEASPFTAEDYPRMLKKRILKYSNLHHELSKIA